MAFDPSGWSDPSTAAVWMAIAVVAGLLGLWLQAAGDRRWNSWWALAPALAIAGATLLRVAVTSGIDSDESEHLHVAYVVGRGVMPYRDFDQNHGPFLWMLIAPLLRVLPETPYVLYLFRALALASFLGSVGIAASLAKQLSRGSGLIAPLCLFLALATSVNAEVYRFRPDPFMNLAALLSLYLLLRPSGNRLRQAFWAGLLHGLAVALSPKLAHLVLLAPLVFLVRGPHGAWRGLLAYGAGGILALVPVLGWLAWNGLLQDAYQGIVGRNLGSTARRLAEGISEDAEVYRLEALRMLQLAPLFLLTTIGAARMLFQRVGERADVALLVAAWALWLCVWAIAPSAGTYHIAGALVLGAGLGAHALDGLASSLASSLASKQARWAPFAMGLILSLCMASAPLRSGVGGWVKGYTYPLARVAWLLDAVRSRGDGCLCLVPWHPIFISTVSPVYVSNERGSRRWGEALEWAMERRPAAVMSRRFNRMAEDGKITASQADRIVRVLRENYKLHSAGSAGFWLLNSRPGS